VYKKHNVIIIGLGLGALSAAARLTELGIKNIGIYTTGYGATPYIAAINFVLPNNPYGDTWQKYCEDMITTGYYAGNRRLVEDMARASREGYELLKRWGVTFAHNPDESIKLRHLSGHSFPRSLCCTTSLIGKVIIDEMVPRLEKAGISINMKCECVRLLTEGNRIHGITIVNSDQSLENIYCPTVIAAWGGVGRLFGKSTYPPDIKGNTIGIAAEAGAEFVDLEFYEFEPMIVLSPAGAVGEPCPTAMLGEGAYLKNADGERFMLSVRPQGEAGSPKTLINNQIWKQVEAEKGSENGGVWVDLRHIDIEVLKSYPWFYNRLLENGADPTRQLIEVGPVPHSISGGIKVNEYYESSVHGLYAIGEACGGIHGACRCAGNASSQAVLSGLICAQAVSKTTLDTILKEFPLTYPKNEAIFNKYVPKARALAAKTLGVYRNGGDLEAAQITLEKQCSEKELKKDEQAYQTLLSILMMVRAANARKESIGTHIRMDYPFKEQL
jgi:aspartate oxidase